MKSCANLQTGSQRVRRPIPTLRISRVGSEARANPTPHSVVTLHHRARQNAKVIESDIAIFNHNLDGIQKAFYDSLENKDFDKKTTSDEKIFDIALFDIEVYATLYVIHEKSEVENPDTKTTMSCGLGQGTDINHTRILRRAQHGRANDEADTSPDAQFWMPCIYDDTLAPKIV